MNEKFPKPNIKLDLEAMSDAIEHNEQRTEGGAVKKFRFFSKEGEKQDTPYTYENAQNMNLEDLLYLKRDADLNGTARDRKIIDSLIEAKETKKDSAIRTIDQLDDNQVA